MEIKLFSAVELIDGREVVIVEIYTDPPCYECEDIQAIKEGRREDVWFSISPDKIKRVVYVPKDV